MKITLIVGFLCVTIIAVTAILMGINGAIVLSAFTILGGGIGVSGKIIYDKRRKNENQKEEKS